MGAVNMIFVCSPYRGDITRNIENAKRYCKIVVKAGKIPIAPHLYFPQFLDDTDPADRKKGIISGLVLMKYCTEVWVFGNEITDGMRQEIDFAESEGIKIKYISEMG